MILSYSKRFLFIKTRKTGGTSVEVVLSHICGDSDIITPMTPIDERLRLEGARPCQNFSAKPEVERDYVIRLRDDPELRKLPKEVKEAQIFYNHMTISEVLERAEFEPKDYFKFTVERHPYEKAVSFANFNLRYSAYTAGRPMTVELSEIPPAIDSLIASGKLIGKIRNYDLYTVGGNVAVDQIIRYECLGQDLEAIARKLGVEGEISLPKTKVGARDRNVPAADILDAHQKKWIADVCKEEFDLMAYPL
jgi:hypothetical protein